MKNILLAALLFTQTCFGVGQDKVWRIPNGGTLPSWGQINLSSSSARTGTLPLGNGGTGLSSCTSGNFPYSNGSTFVCDDVFKRYDANTLIAPAYLYMGGSFGSGNAFLSGYANDTIAIGDGANASASVYPIVTSWSNSNQTTPGHGMVIVRGQVAANGTINQGEGFTINKSGTGTYDINFTTTFGTTPVTTVTTLDATTICIGSIISNSTSQVRVYTASVSGAGSGTPSDRVFNFIAIGRR
jgi:hypothetical protein